MARLRTIPYGYVVRLGNIEVDPMESKVVRSIFSLYTQGHTMKSIADELMEKEVVYFQNEVRWNKNSIKRIIENEKYIGNDIYNPIVDCELFRQANNLKNEKSRPSSVLSPEISRLKGICVCGRCGTRFKRINTWGSREKWMCANGCRCGRFIDDSILLNSVHETAAAVINDPSLLSVSAHSLYLPSKDVLREENELIRLLEQPKISFMSSAKSILRTASLRFQCCQYDRGEITSALQEELKDIRFTEAEGLSFIKKYIRKVRIYPDGIISVVFFNGAEVLAKGGVSDECCITETCDKD